MKRYLCLFLFIALTLSAPHSGFSQVPNTTYITAYGGLSIPANQNLYTNSFNAGAAFEFALSKLTAFGFDVNFANLSSKKNEFELLYLGYQLYDYGNYSTMGIMAFFKLQNKDAIGLAVQPFVKAGLGTTLMAKTGVSFKSYGLITNVPNETSTGILFAPSAGINIPVNKKNKIMIEAQFRMNKSDSQNVNLFLLNFGYSFRL